MGGTGGVEGILRVNGGGRDRCVIGEPNCRRCDPPRFVRAAFPEGDMHGPVAVVGALVLARTVERVDDPHPRRGEAPRIVGRLLRQNGVVGPGGPKLSEDELVRLAVTLVAQ